MDEYYAPYQDEIDEAEFTAAAQEEFECRIVNAKCGTCRTEDAGSQADLIAKNWKLVAGAEYCPSH